MPKISELDKKMNVAINKLMLRSHEIFEECGLEGDVQYHEFTARLAVQFAQDTAGYAVTERRREEDRTHDGYELKGSDEE